jgi:hypothetical protein
MSIYSSTCFGRFSAHHQELNDCNVSLWFYLRIVVVVVPHSWSGRPRTQHDCHHDTKVIPEAATAVIELLIMGGKTPETCWAVNKSQDNELENCCILLVINFYGVRHYESLNVGVRWCGCVKLCHSSLSVFVMTCTFHLFFYGFKGSTKHHDFKSLELLLPSDRPLSQKTRLL